MTDINVQERTDTRLLEQVSEMIEDLLGFEPDEYTNDDSFADDLEADSLSMVQLQITVEETFAITITSDEVVELTTPALLIAFIARKRTGTT